MEYGLSENTLSAYRNDLFNLMRWLSEIQVAIADAKREHLLKYLSFRVAEGIQPRSAARLLSSIRRFYRYQLRQGIYRPILQNRLNFRNLEGNCLWY